MRKGIYISVMAYGVLPLIFFTQISYLVYGYVVSKFVRFDLLLATLLPIALYLIAAVTVIREKDSGYVWMQAAFASSIVRMIVKTADGIQFENMDKKSSIINLLISVLVLGIWMFINSRFERKEMKLRHQEMMEDSLQKEDKPDEIETQYKTNEFGSFYNSDIYGTSNKSAEAQTETPKKKLISIARSIGFALVLLIIAEWFFYLYSDWYSIIYNLFSEGRKLSILQEQKLAMRLDSILSFCEVFIAFWLAFVFSKAKIVSLDVQGFVKSKRPVKSLGVGAVTAIIIIFGAAIILVMMHAKIETNHISVRIAEIIIYSVFMFIGIGFAEEVVCRGILLGYCEKENIKVWGVILSTVFFVSIHFINGVYDRWSQVLFLTACALLYSAIKLYNSNLWVCIGFHFMYDWMVTRFIEIRTLRTSECFMSVIKLTYWKQSLAISIPCFVLAAALFYEEIRRRSNE